MSIQLPPDLVVSVSGFRGRVGAPLTPELVCSIAAAFGDWLQVAGQQSTVVVGRDSRTSGPMLVRGVIAGLQSVGCSVVDLGVVPTPTLMLAVEHHRAAGGVCVTASHNPAEWNALKLASAEGMFVDAEGMESFLNYLQSTDPNRADWSALGEVVNDEAAVDRHLQAIERLPQLDVSAISGAGIKVALDCVNGAGGTVMPRLLESLGCEVVGIGLEVDGRFPRDPEPTAANLGDLARLVRESGAAVGLAVDPDVDRLSLVDETGQPLGEDFTLALASAVVLKRTPGTVVTNLSTSQVVDDVAEAHGGSVVRTPVGEINVARRMQLEGAVVGGEGNGGVILPDLHHTRDAPLAAALILQHLVDEGRPLSQIVAGWPKYGIVKEKVRFPRGAIEDAYGVLENDLAGAVSDRADGLRLAWPDRKTWLHVRPSGTEPVVRLIAEAPRAAEAEELVARAARLLEGVA
ncbi:MAG: phosphoglucosamine mutase [Gemmatimonadetes bacterium]|nr:phosphoglucosamine mutase [Gemmatimonadota bacterium]